MLTYLVSLFQDYQEEISVAQENKHQLQVMGERLARSSQDSKAAEIRHKLSKVSERWQHLLDLIAARWVYKTLRITNVCTTTIRDKFIYTLSNLALACGLINGKTHTQASQCYYLNEQREVTSPCVRFTLHILRRITPPSGEGFILAKACHCLVTIVSFITLLHT